MDAFLVLFMMQTASVSANNVGVIKKITYIWIGMNISVQVSFFTTSQNAYLSIFKKNALKLRQDSSILLYTIKMC